MTPKTLFSIILKVLGIFFIKDIWELIPQLLSTLLYYVSKPDLLSTAVISFVSIFFVIFMYSFFSYYLIFKTDLLIEKLKLDKDMDPEPIPINVHRSTVLSISIIVVGGLLIVDSVPNLCRQLMVYFQESNDRYRQANPTVSYIVLNIVKIAMGFLLVAEQRRMVNFIERKRQK